MIRPELNARFFLWFSFILIFLGSAASSAGDSTSLHHFLSQKKLTETEQYEKNLINDLQKFSNLAGKLQNLCDGALEPGSYLDKLSDPKILTNQKMLRTAYRFWNLFYTFQLDLEKLSYKYEIPLLFKHKRKVKQYFTGYVLGISARFCRLICISDLMIFLNTRQRLADVFNERNTEFGFPARSLDHAVKSALKPETLAHLYRFRISHFAELNKLLLNDKNAMTRIPAAYLIANQTIFDELSHKVANDPTWKFLSNSVINYSLDFILPAQRSIFTWVGDTRVRQKKSRFISRSQRQRFSRMLQPGDIVLSRQEWYLSNVFLPGFWPHAMLYIGSAKEVKQKFAKDPETEKWCQDQGVNDFIELLRQDFPIAFEKWTNHGDNKIRLFMEATSDGIILESLDHSCHSDHLAAMRPQLQPIAIAKAIHTAFSYFGREYDFQFSFNTEQTLVCTELVAKAYAAPGRDGLRFPVVERLGKHSITADSMVEFFAADQKSDQQQLEFVACLKGNLQSRRAIFTDKDDFAGSYKWQGGLQSSLSQ